MNPRRLPVETLEAILEHTTKNEQLALCTSSKLLHDLAIRILYRDLRFTRSSQLVQCFRVLKYKQGHALAVMTLNIATVSDTQHLRAYFRLIKDVLARLSRLKRLDLQQSDRHSERRYDILDTCVFPRLHTLIFDHMDGLYAAKFLGRHPNIATLSISSMRDEHPARDFRYIQLPNLRAYISRTRILPSWLSRSTSLEHLALFYDYQHPKTEKTFEALSHTHAKRLDLILAGWNLECCGVLSRTLPTLKAIGIQNMGGNQTVKISHFIENFSASLPTFNRLEEFTLADSASVSTPLTFSVLDREHELVQEWYCMCPELKMCEFGAGVTWTLESRLHRFAWVPVPAAGDVASTLLVDQWQLESS
ncbi:hypothetical protein FIBSPDRAFT_1039056 [Athelia psychrophila]|uniref:F-box domain-containing protein n=1 Tax=Athelia psychrophila TaxID=1759441 RepID=A0A166S5C7_9AGAM|nr:hypothetical protein FIBSPDRAFT_1039056 [Fibularhizoctonia sp. CBS 109695]